MIKQASAIKQSFVDIFRKPQYLVFAVFVTACITMCMTLIQNIPFIKTIWTTDTFSLFGKLNISFQSLYAFNTNLTHLSQFFHIIIALLIATHLTFLIYYYRARRRLEGSAGIGFIGIFSGIVGIGCSVCGSVVLSSLIGLSAATTLITMLPLRGVEFSLLAIIILLSANGYLGIKLQEPVACKKK